MHSFLIYQSVRPTSPRTVPSALIVGIHSVRKEPSNPVLGVLGSKEVRLHSLLHVASEVDLARSNIRRRTRYATLWQISGNAVSTTLYEGQLLLFLRESTCDLQRIVARSHACSVHIYPAGRGLSNPIVQLLAAYAGASRTRRGPFTCS